MLIVCTNHRVINTANVCAITVDDTDILFETTNSIHRRVYRSSEKAKFVFTRLIVEWGRNSRIVFLSVVEDEYANN